MDLLQLFIPACIPGLGPAGLRAPRVRHLLLGSPPVQHLRRWAHLGDKHRLANGAGRVAGSPSCLCVWTRLGHDKPHAPVPASHCCTAALSSRICQGLLDIRMIDASGRVLEEPRWGPARRATAPLPSCVPRRGVACMAPCLTYLLAPSCISHLTCLLPPPAFALARKTKRPWLAQLQRVVPELGGVTEWEKGRALPQWPESSVNMNAKAVSLPSPNPKGAGVPHAAPVPPQPCNSALAHAAADRPASCVFVLPRSAVAALLLSHVGLVADEPGIRSA